MKEPRYAEETELVGLSTIDFPKEIAKEKSKPIIEQKIKANRKHKRAKKKNNNNVNIGEFLITAYCPCYECSEGYGRKTSTGRLARANHTIAVDPRVIPYGTKVHIKGVGDFIAEDCGGDVKGNHIDVYFDHHRTTESFGRKHKKVYITKK